MKEFLLQSSLEIGIHLSSEQLEQFQIYYDFLLEKNRVMNLTTITEEKDIVIKHFVDSIALLKFVSLNHGSVIDVGTGAGFPGIPLAILLPEISFVLMDSLNKRILFLEEVIKKCNIHNVKLIHGRAEDIARNLSYRESFDICVSRAVANMSTLLEYCIPFLKVGGKFISYKSGKVQEELEKSINAQRVLNCVHVDTISFDLPYSDFHRSFILFEKENHISKRYPRQAGKPKREPL